VKQPARNRSIERRAVDQVLSCFPSLQSIKAKVAGAVWRNRILARAFFAKALERVSLSATRPKRCCRSWAIAFTWSGLPVSVSIVTQSPTNDGRLLPDRNAGADSEPGFPWTCLIARNRDSSWISKTSRMTCFISSLYISRPLPVMQRK
jgi:hypothetical protein